MLLQMQLRLLHAVIDAAYIATNVADNAKAAADASTDAGIAATNATENTIDIVNADKIAADTAIQIQMKLFQL